MLAGLGGDSCHIIQIKQAKYCWTTVNSMLVWIVDCGKYEWFGVTIEELIGREGNG